jgi:hypothetical protein
MSRRGRTIHIGDGVFVRNWDISVTFQDRLHEAEEYMRLAVDGGIKMYGKAHSDILDSLNTLEATLKERGQGDELEQLR